jgi:ribosomal protein L37AE/L43A
MKVLLPAFPAVAALALAATPAIAQTAPAESPAAAPQIAPASGNGKSESDNLLPPVQKIGRWEDTGMKPPEAREWQTYNFTPHEAVNWKAAGFPPLVARTWSDKGFDADEAREWLDSTKHNRPLMADLDHSDPAQWKREGLSPQDRLAWWEAGFTFEDAVLLFRAGMSPATAAWHGQEKLRELKALDSAKGETKGTSTDLEHASEPLQLQHIWEIIKPFILTGAVAVIAFITGGLAFFLFRRGQVNRQLAEVRNDAPDSEMPVIEKPAAPAHQPPRRPARRFALFTSSTPHCIHCKSTNVRQSRMHPHRFAGINFTDYFRCKHCGKHFAIVSYTPILAAGSAVVLLVTIFTSGFIYLVSLVP